MPRVANRRRGPASDSGFTLIELVISGALMAIILSASYVCLNAGLATQKLIEPRLQALQTARVTLALLSADLRCACPLSKEKEFIGMKRRLGEMDADNLDFGTHNYTPARAGEGDFCQVSYFVEKNPDTGEATLWRRRNPRIGVDPLAGGRREEIAKGLRQLKFEYYDGFDWYDTWGDTDERTQVKNDNSMKVRSNLTGLPDAVRIKLAIAPNPKTPTERGAEPDEDPPLVFETLVCLNLAHVGGSSPGAGAVGSGTGTPGAPGTPGASGPVPGAPMGGGF